MAVQYIDGRLVLASTGYDQIRLLLGWLDEFKIHRTDGLLVLRQNRIQGSTSLLRVSSQSSGQTDIHGNVDEDFQVNAIHQFQIMKDQNAFQYDDIGGRKCQTFGFAVVL